MSSTANAAAAPLPGAGAGAGAALMRTPFHQFHLDHGAKMVEYAGWDMPLLYRSIIQEHQQVRSSAGLFDVSHMGRIRFSGRDARAFLDHVCTRQIDGMGDGQCRYSLVCNESGGCRDDVLVYRLAEDQYLMVCNAANRAKLLEHFAAVKAARGFVFKQVDETTTTAMVAIQGPKVMGLISRFSSEVPTLKRYRFVEKSLLMARFLISRTGYTGEDGVEVILPAMLAGLAVRQLLPDMDAWSDVKTQAIGKRGQTPFPGHALKPIGLGARDTLRLEAGMPLYGHEITEELDPLAAGLDFAVKLDKADRFIGQEALGRIAADGLKRRLVGLVLDGRRAARQGMKVAAGGRDVGLVTSGAFSPTLQQPIAMAHVDAALAQPGTALQVELGAATAEAKVVALPFYKKQS
jgi:aminomethyltransferase